MQDLVAKIVKNNNLLN